MKIQSKLLGGAFVALAGIASAHHISVALSHLVGPEILTSIDVYLSPFNEGTPAYQLATGEHDHDIALADGDSFAVVDEHGVAQTVVFHAADFADIGHATDHEVIDAIAAQLSNAVAFSNNGFLGLRGLTGGTTGRLGLTDVTPGTLDKLQLEAGNAFGADDIAFELSIPADGPFAQPGLEGHPYLLLASTLDGSFVRQGKTIPIGLHSSVRKFAGATYSGLLPSFRGQLNATADAHATLPVDAIETILGTTPSQIYLAHVVFSQDFSSIEYVSNQFVVNVLP